LDIVVCQRGICESKRRTRKGLTKAERHVLKINSGSGSHRFKEWLLSRPVDVFVVGPKRRDAFVTEEKVSQGQGLLQPVPETVIEEAISL